jgi:hypothetical protein
VTPRFVGKPSEQRRALITRSDAQIGDTRARTSASSTKSAAITAATTALETARRADADQVAHHKPEIESAHINEEPLTMPLIRGQSP